MKRLGLLICAFLQLVALAALVSCGGGGGGEAAHAPTISNLSYSPSSAFASPNGTVAVNGTMNVSDAGGDVTTLRMTTSAGADLSIPVTWPAGATSGAGTGQFVVSVDKPGTYTFEVWAVDRAGSASNRLTGTFEVVPVANANRAPSISNLRLAPSSAAQVAGGTATISAYVDFTDAIGDVAAVRVKSSAGLDVTIPTPTLRGATKGTATAQWPVSIDKAGSYAFDVWALDSEGLASNHLSGAFEVLSPSSAPHAPSISNLRVSPSSASQAWNATASVTATVDFADTGADIAWVRIVSNAGIDQSIAVAAFSGSKSGTGSVTFAMPVDQAGNYPFSLFVTDAQGTASNELTGSFEVLAATTAPWVKLGVSPPNTLLGVASSGRQYVAVGAAGTVMTSADSANWQVQNSGVAHTLRSVASSGSRFVAVGNSADGEAVVIGSADGVTWSVLYRSAPAGSSLAKVIWAGTQFIAIGQEHIGGKLYGLVLTSPDGLAWTQRASQSIELGDPGYSAVKSMTSGASSGSLMVAIGMTPSEDPAVWVSTNLDTWTAGALPSSAVWMFPPSDIAWGHGRFVAVSPAPGWNSGAPTFVSTDGRNWQGSPASPNLPGMEAVTSGADGFLAVGSSYRMSSPDGLTWTVSPMNGCGNAVLWDGVRYVSVGSSICKSQ